MPINAAESNVLPDVLFQENGTYADDKSRCGSSFKYFHASAPSFDSVFFLFEEVLRFASQDDTLRKNAALQQIWILRLFR